jgi:glycosyltransferase involved in cell wall biosynthesis
MKIAYLCHSPIPSNVASSIHVMRVCQALAQLGADVTLFCPAVPRGKMDPAQIHDFYGVQPVFKIRRLPRPQSWTDRIISTPRMFRWQVTLRRFDLIYARCNAWAPYRLHKVMHPMILEAHLLHDKDNTARLLRSPWVRGLVVISEVLRRDYVAMYELGDLKVLVAHDGADPASARDPVQLPGVGSVKCGYVGNLYRGKGMEMIIPLAERCPQVDFHVFGGTEDQVAMWRAAMGASEIANLWLHGSLRPADTDAARLACDLLIAPYQEVVRGAGDQGDLARWMSPLKIFEYMAAGRAIIASDLPTLREVLRDRENALLVPPDDLEAWTNAVSELAADATLRQRLSARALGDFVGQHSWRARTRRIVDAFASPQAEAKATTPVRLADQCLVESDSGTSTTDP